MMSGHDFALLAHHLNETRPKKEEAIAVWQQYSECVQAVAKACLDSNSARFKKHIFLRQCFGENHYDPARSKKGSKR